MSTLRKLNREVQRRNKALPMKKVVARKLGLTMEELNRKYFKKSKEK